MSRIKVYIAFMATLVLGFILPKLLDPNRGFIFIVEELFVVGFIVLGALLFRQKVEKSIGVLDKNHPWESHPKKRFFKTTATAIRYIFWTYTVLIIIVWGYMHQYGLPDFYHQILLKKEALTGRGRHEAFPTFFPLTHRVLFLSAALFTTLFAIEEIFNYYQRVAERKSSFQQLLNEQATLKANALKKQLDPHFMFNTLNVLSGLIHEDIDKSDIFIKELSNIYRYVLEQSEEAVSTLSQEVGFIESYLFLLKIRFEDKLQAHIAIPAADMERLIPSLTLEILVENAIKHNQLSKKAPLVVDIYLENDCLIVKNNLQLRSDTGHSHGIGLTNLSERLRLLGVHNARFEKTNDHFIATIPLIK